MEVGKEPQKKSPAAHIFASETLILLVGLGLVVYGLVNGFKYMQVFYGVCIIGGSFALRLVRKKDWQAHWEEMERVRQNHERRAEQEREKKQ